jgi:hypothetical protein
MDVAGRRERADIADLISLRPTRLRSAVDQLVMLASLDDTEPAPGDVSRIRAVCGAVDVI